MRWYNSWHNHPRHQHAHWLIFFSAVFLVSALLFIELLGLSQEKNSIAQAQTPCDPSVIPPDYVNVVIVCDIAPTFVKPDDTVRISGHFMGNIVQLSNDSTGNVEQIEGKDREGQDLVVVNSTYTLLTFVVPLGTPDGTYGISVVSVDGLTNGTSNKDLIIAKNPSNPPPTQPNPQQPFPQDPSRLTPPPATSFESLISSVFNYAIWLVGIAVFIMIMYAGFLWLTSAAVPGNIATAKKMISNAILGAILLISAYAILYTVNPELVGGELNLKGIRPPSPTGTSTQSLVAFNEPQAASAITSGCIITTEKEDFTAVDCPPDAELMSGLVQNPILEAGDINVNDQVGATILQTNGNQGAGRKIVVLDTGYNYNHPELNSSYLGGHDFVNNDNDPMDDHTNGQGVPPGHGSHVAGIITADGLDPRARGVAPQAGIIAGKILDYQGSGTWDKMIDAIYWAVDGPDRIYGTADDFRADVINISVGGGSYNSICDNADNITQRTAKAIQYAKDNGVLVVTASGNVSNGVVLPGCIDAAFTVGAVDRSDRITNFSGRGPTVDIVAPGVNIYSTLLNSNYGNKTGTSQATPVVSGVAALLKAANPSYNAYQLEQAITSTACDLGSVGKDSIFGWGRITATPGSCTPPPPAPSTGITGSIIISPSSCTKGSLPVNPNCDTTVNYTINGITSPTSLALKRDNSTIQNIQCGGVCSGQFNDQNPSAGTHRYTVNLSNNSVVARRNSYIYATSTLTSSFTSCDLLSNLNNPNCDITLNISVVGISPSSVILTKNGINWRVIACPTSPCTSTVTDLNPGIGIHTYAIFYTTSLASTRLSRATVNITGASNLPPIAPSSVTLCTGVNFTGTCETFSATRTVPDLRNTRIGNDMSQSIRVTNIGRVYLCRDINYGGLCYGFGTGNYPNLSNFPVIGASAASSMMEAPILDRVTICTGVNFTGNCEIFLTPGDDTDLSNNAIGNDTASSVYVDRTDLELYSDINYGGIRQDLVGTRTQSGVYPNLANEPIGDNQVSSIRF